MDIPAWWQSLGPWWANDGWPWVSEWLKSPGFAGFAAVLAATMAFLGSRHQARLNSWWQRVEWALNLYTDPKSTQGQRMTGLAAIGAAQDSRLTKKPEQDFISSVVDANTLDLLGDGTDEDDVKALAQEALDAAHSGLTQVDEPYSKQEQEVQDDEARVREEGRAPSTD